MINHFSNALVLYISKTSFQNADNQH